jgi:hypothetical protein
VAAGHGRQHSCAKRQRGDLVAIFPDGVIDFAFEAQFGEMSARRCFAVLLEAATSPVPFSAPVVQTAPSDHMPTVQAINACRAELGGNANYLTVRKCVIQTHLLQFARVDVA